MNAALKTARGPGGLSVVGSLPEIRRDPMAFGRKLVESYGDAVLFRLGPMKAIAFTHPACFEHVLQARSDNYRKSYAYRRMEPLLGRGLITAEGKEWLKKRRIIQPAFHRKAVAGLFGTMSDCVRDLVATWQQSAAAGQPVDVNADIVRLTLRIISQGLLGADMSETSQSVGAALGVFMAEAEHRILSMFNFPDAIPTPRNLRLKRAVRILDDAVVQISAAHQRAGGDSRGPLLELLLAAKEEDGSPTLSPREIRDEIMTIFIAGHETSANVLTWALLELASRPELVEQLAQELERVAPGRMPTVEELSQLPLLGTVVDEVLRLYPPVWITSREAIAEDVIDGYAVKPGQLIVLPFYFLHRRPDFWTDPEVFRPERFAAADIQKARKAFMPFGFGPRQCIGASFAILEIKVALAMVLRTFKLSLAAPAPSPKPTLTLRPSGPALVKLEAR